MKTSLTLKKEYIVDLETDAGGEEIIAHPALIHSITVVSDDAGDANISFSDSTTSYDADERCVKVKTTDENHTVHLVYDGGLPLSSGLCATSNKASVDLSGLFFNPESEKSAKGNSEKSICNFSRIPLLSLRPLGFIFLIQQKHLSIHDKTT